MALKRPYIPVRIRRRAAELQAEQAGARISDCWWKLYHAMVLSRTSNTKKLYYLLEALFGGDDVQLDHDPALELRKRRRNGTYIPDANDPHYLVYRTVPDHEHKTFGREPGASRTVTTKGSDTWVAKKFRKLERPKKSKRKIPSRPFAKSRSSSATSVPKGS